MDEYNSSLIENKTGTTGKTTTDSDTKQYKMNLSPIKNSPEDSPLRRALEQPPLKRFKVGRTQDAGTITEPDSLGPCEPGTAINLDGIVWNETKGGLLSLNITWRGKSFMGTLMDCSTTEHGSEWASPWVGDNEAPDQKPKVSRNKKKKSKKKRKKRKNIEEPNLNQDVSLENIDLDDNDEGEDSVIEPEIPIELVECKSDNCGKKFSSESALKYHVSFAHEKIIQKKQQTVSSDCISIAPPTEKVEPETGIENPKKASEEMESESNEVYITKQYGVEKEVGNFEAAIKKVEIEKPKSKPFPSMQNIRPIVPVQHPQIAGSSLKPIQPKPTILPAPAVNLCLDSLKRLTKKSPGQKMEKSPKSIATDTFPKGIPKYQNVNNYEEEPVVIDLSTNKDIPNIRPKSPVQQESNSLQKFPATNLYSSTPQNAKSIQREAGLPYNTQQERDTKMQESVLLKIPNPSQKSPKDRSPSIFVKTEFNTGHRQNLSDQTDQPEIIKHTKSGTNVPIPPKSIMPSIFANPMGYLPHSYFSSHSTVPGLMMPPLNTNPLMLPGLMNIPATAAPSSPFGSSLESLARAAEERARNFGNYSPAHVPAAFSPAHVPAAFAPSLIPTSSANTQRAGPPPSSDSSEAPLLRHEHMHTHLHYITSPTHSQ